MEAGDVLKLYLGIMVAIFLIWLLAGGPNAGKSGGFNLTSFFLPTAVSPQSMQVPQEKEKTLDEIEWGVKDATSKAETIQQGIKNVRESSPYKGKVFLAEGQARDRTLTQQYITLSVSSLFRDSIAISGWKLHSTITGKTATIGEAPSIPAFPSRSELQAITIRSGDLVTVNSGSSPIGTSFRANACTGYFAQSYTFIPSVRIDCPRVADDASLTPKTYDDACLDFIQQIPACTVPKNVPVALSSLCKNYIATKITYAACVSDYKGSPGFYKNEWRIYLNSSELLWKEKREEIELIDADNKLVDTIFY